MNQTFSKIWILIILIVFIAGGILAWQYLMAPEEEAKVPEEKVPEEVELNYKNMLGQMFPEKEFSEVKEKYFNDRENRTYYVEEVLEGSFIKLDEKNILLIVRRPMDELAHVEGFYQAFLAVFDIEGKEILTETMALNGDEGKIALYNCEEGTFVFFTRSVTYQGWMEGGVSLYKIKDRKFEEIWPEDEEIWILNRIVEPKEDRLVVYEREKIESDFVCPTQCLYVSIFRPESVMYSYAFVYSYDLYWNSNTCSFELIDETADWEVYQNEEYGFEIKYPVEMKEEETLYQGYEERGFCSIGEGCYTSLFSMGLSYSWEEPPFQKSPLDWNLDPKNYPICFGLFFVQVLEKPPPFSLGELKEKYKKSEYIIVDGVKGLRRNEFKGEPPGGGGNEDVVYLPKNSKLYLVRFIVDGMFFKENMESCVKGQTRIFNEMLSTFKFIEK